MTLENIFKARAKENQGTRTDLCQKSDKSINPIDTKKELAKLADELIERYRVGHCVRYGYP